MARNPVPSSMDHSDEEDYIDIEVSSCSYFSSRRNSPPQNREFEFQMSSITNNKESTTSPADELFFGGRLLPLHQKILQTELFEQILEEDSFCINFLITPIGSPSFELNPNDQHLFQWSTTQLTTSIVNHNSPKKLWSKLIKHSLISQKFKASRAFLKSLLSKSSCCSKDMNVSQKTIPLRNTTLSSRSFSAAEMKWNSPTKCMSSRSFSEADIKWQQKSRHGSSRSSFSTNSSSSSNCSFNSNNEFNFLKRRSSFTSEIEGSIDAAVAHCKKSQDPTISTNKLSVAGLK